MPAAQPFDNCDNRKFNNSLIFCDTSFLLDLLGEKGDTPITTECEDLLLNIIHNKGITVLSTLNQIELENIYRKRSTKAEIRTADQRELKSYRISSPEDYEKAIRLPLSQVGKVTSTLLKMPPFYPEVVGNISNSTFTLAMDYQNSYCFPTFFDAMHLAIVRQEQGSAFLTTDSDFLRVNEPEIQIYYGNVNK